MGKKMTIHSYDFLEEKRYAIKRIGRAFMGRILSTAMTVVLCVVGDAYGALNQNVEKLPVGQGPIRFTASMRPYTATTAKNLYTLAINLQTSDLSGSPVTPLSYNLPLKNDLQPLISASLSTAPLKNNTSPLAYALQNYFFRWPPKKSSKSSSKKSSKSPYMGRILAQQWPAQITNFACALSYALIQQWQDYAFPYATMKATDFQTQLETDWSKFFFDLFPSGNFTLTPQLYFGIQLAGVGSTSTTTKGTTTTKKLSWIDLEFMFIANTSQTAELFRYYILYSQNYFKMLQKKQNPKQLVQTILNSISYVISDPKVTLYQEAGLAWVLLQVQNFVKARPLKFCRWPQSGGCVFTYEQL